MWAYGWLINVESKLISSHSMESSRFLRLFPGAWRSLVWILKIAMEIQFVNKKMMPYQRVELNVCEEGLAGCLIFTIQFQIPFAICYCEYYLIIWWVCTCVTPTTVSRQVITELIVEPRIAISRYVRPNLLFVNKEHSLVLVTNCVLLVTDSSVVLDFILFLKKTLKGQ